jgi:Asp-tRNA(Asn)/Glu-tRNA(Gln) amidotransferase A subunit family amidase
MFAVNYDPHTAAFLSFSRARGSFASGADSPRAFLERCLERIDELEPSIRAFVRLDIAGARSAADAATRRWQRNAARSAVDGLPVGIKDCFDVRGFPTELNSALFAGNTASLDAAHVDALRRGGAVIVGKTTTTELTMALPAPTLNPWNHAHTPGGSSSGSAAAVAARMLPLATGSQVRGSVIRPASICGVVGMKPTFGALNRYGGIEITPSLNHLGFLGGTLSDIWEAAQHIASVVGGDPGFAPLSGSACVPAAQRPLRLARQLTCGWPKTDEASKSAFEELLRSLEARGIEIIEPDASDQFAAYEEATTRTPEFFFDILAWELRWPLRVLNEDRPGCISEGILGHIRKAEQMTLDDYRRAMLGRDRLRALHRDLRGKVDGFITLAHIGPGQRGLPPVGTPWYNDASSAIGAPTFNLPLLATDGLPLGVQLMGFEGEDEALAAHARWLLEALGSSTAR